VSTTTGRPSVREVQTPAGIARIHLARPARPRGSLVLGHGAGGGVAAPDLQALTTLVTDGWVVGLVEQPWRVAGRRVATPPPQLDIAWLAVLQSLRRGRSALPRPLVVGGRSAGARVACRTAEAVDADAVLALAFPLHPPGKPERSRAHEARLVSDAGTRLAVIQGEKDPFGTPEELRAALAPEVALLPVAGAHAFARDPVDVVAAARTWLEGI
jgi:uncharacterized protein